MPLRPLLLALLALQLLGAFACGQSTVLSIHGSSQLPDLGRAVTGLGDIDGDLVPDFAAAGRGLSGTRGFVSAYSGQDGSMLWTHAGLSPLAANLQISLAGAGDLDLDGRDDLLAGAWSSSGPGTGRVSVLSGASGAVLFVLHGVSAFDGFGSSLCGLGDTNGDGWVDFAVGAPRTVAGGQGDGYVRVFSGFLGALLHHLTLPASLGPQSGFGTTVTSLGDVDGDGMGDLAVGAPGAANGTTQPSGRLELFSGLSGVSLGSIPNPTVNPGFGASMTVMSDVDGDGLRDIAAAIPDPTLSGPGSTQPAPGASLLTVRIDGTLIWSAAAPAVGGFWDAIAATPHFGASGVTDLVVARHAPAVQPRMVSGAQGCDLGPIGSAPPVIGTPPFVSIAGMDLGGSGAGDFLVGYSATGSMLVIAGSLVSSASATTLGTGFPPAAPPQLTADLPILGGVLGLGLTGNLFSGQGTLVIAPAPENPTAIVPGLIIWPDPLAQSSWIMLPVNTDAAGSWTMDVPLPPLAALEGSMWVLQAWLPFGSGISNSLFSNGLLLTLGY